MGLSDLLMIELHNDNLKKFNEDWEKKILSLGKTWMMNCWTVRTTKQLEKFSLVKNASLCLRQLPESSRLLHFFVADFPKSQRRNQLISQKERSQNRTDAANSSNSGNGTRQAKIADRQQQEDHVRRGQKMFVRTQFLEEERKAKDRDEGVLLREGMLQTLQMSNQEDKQKSLWKKMTDLSGSTPGTELVR